MVKYRRLKMKLMLQTILIGFSIAAVGFFLLRFFIDGIWQEPFADAFTGLCENIGMNNASAVVLYNTIFRDNKVMLVGIFFMILLIIAFNMTMSTYMNYLLQVESGIENILID